MAKELSYKVDKFEGKITVKSPDDAFPGKGVIPRLKRLWYGKEARMVSLKVAAPELPEDDKIEEYTHIYPKETITLWTLDVPAERDPISGTLRSPRTRNGSTKTTTYTTIDNDNNTFDVL